MEQAILIVHALVALAIIGLIMLQQGKGADMGASFGAGGSQTLFGSQGSGNMLTKATAILVTLFFGISLGLAVLAKERAQVSGLIDIPAPAVVESPITMREVSDIPEGEVVDGSADDIPVAAELELRDPPEGESDLDIPAVQ